MKNYEIIVSFNPELSDGDLANSTERIKTLVASEGGEIAKIADPLKKTLGYKIKGKKEAFVVSFTISLSTDKVAPLNEKIKKETFVLRLMILEVKKHKAVKEARTPRVKRELDAATGDRQFSELDNNKFEVKPETKKVEIKEIDQKIEEILNE